MFLDTQLVSPAAGTAGPSGMAAVNEGLPGARWMPARRPLEGAQLHGGGPPSKTHVTGRRTSGSVCGAPRSRFWRSGAHAEA